MREIDKATLKAARDVLRKAKRLLTKVGWVRGTLAEEDEEGNVTGYCALGAIDAQEYDFATRKLAKDLLWSAVKGAHNSIAAWNDSSTKARVIRGFERAIAYKPKQVRA